MICWLCREDRNCIPCRYVGKAVEAEMMPEVVVWPNWEARRPSILWVSSVYSIGFYFSQIFSIVSHGAGSTLRNEYPLTKPFRFSSFYYCYVLVVAGLFSTSMMTGDARLVEDEWIFMRFSEGDFRIKILRIESFLLVVLCESVIGAVTMSMMVGLW